MLAAAYASALYLRLQAIAVNGGLSDYVPWAFKNYFGGPTSAYLSLADELLGLRYSSMAYPPGYPALLALFRLVGIDDLNLMRAAQGALDSAGVFLAYFLLRRAGVGAALALCGSVVYATYPLWVVGSTFLLAESLSPVFVLASLSIAVLWAQGERPPWGALAGGGFFIGMVALARPDLLLLPAALGGWLLWCHPNRRGALSVAVVLAGFALPIAGWGVYNRVEHGHWMFSTTGGGNALWEGLGEIPNDYGYVLDDVKAAEIARQKGYEWFSPEADRYFRSDYFRAWREHPEFVLRVLARRWGLLVSESEGWFPQAGLYHRLRLAFDLMGLGLVAGAVIVAPRSRVSVLVAALPVAYALASIGMTHWEPRYVRYVHLSYLFSALVLLAAARDRLRLGSRTAAVLTGSACAVVAWAAAGAMIAVPEAATSTRATAELVRREARDGLSGGYELCSATFRPAVTGAVVGQHECRLEITTSPEPYTYQAMAEVAVPRGSAVILRFSGRLAKGGINVGLLTGDEARFIASTTRDKVGEFSGELLGYAGSHDRVHIVISNHEPSGGRSRVTFAWLELKCSPAPCGPGRRGP